MSLQETWAALEASPVGDFVASSAWAFPLVESLHVISIVTVLGTVAIMDLRLLGLTSGGWAVTQVSRDTLRWTWLGFACAVVTGSTLFVSKAHIYAIEPYFLWKLALMGVAALNMLYLHTHAWKRVGEWDTSRQIPNAVKIAGLVSLTCWVIIIFCGRFIGFTLGHYE